MQIARPTVHCRQSPRRLPGRVQDTKDWALQDRYLVLESSDRRAVLIGMWDGHGPKGGLVSDILCTSFEQYFGPSIEGCRAWSDTTWVCEFTRYFDAAQGRLFAAKDTIENAGASGLVVAMVFTPEIGELSVHVANCGDTEVAYCRTGRPALFLSERDDAQNLSEATRLLTPHRGDATHTRTIFQPFYDTKSNLFRHEGEYHTVLSPVYAVSGDGDVRVRPPPIGVKPASFDICATYFATAKGGIPVLPYKVQMSRAFGNFQATGAPSSSLGGLTHIPHINHTTFSLAAGPAALVLGTNGFWNPFRRTCISRHLCPWTEQVHGNGELTCAMLLTVSNHLSELLSPDYSDDATVAYVALPFLS
jgi:serine/threonine protein phosphatase PrpC